jgi:hypothetical protein
MFSILLKTNRLEKEKDNEVRKGKEEIKGGL